MNGLNWNERPIRCILPGEELPVITEAVCKKCGGRMVRPGGSNFPILFCENSPKCKNQIEDFDKKIKNIKDLHER